MCASTLSNVGINNTGSSQIAGIKPILTKKAVNARLLAEVLWSFCWSLLSFVPIPSRKDCHKQEYQSL